MGKLACLFMLFILGACNLPLKNVPTQVSPPQTTQPVVQTASPALTATSHPAKATAAQAQKITFSVGPDEKTTVPTAVVDLPDENTTIFPPAAKSISLFRGKQDWKCTHGSGDRSVGDNGPAELHAR